MPAAKQINTDGLSEGDFQTLATKLEAASAMLAALKRVRVEVKCQGAWDQVDAAIAQAEAAGIKGES